MMPCVEMRQKLNKVAMKKGEDPAMLFDKLRAIENQYTAAGCSIDEGDLIAVVLDVAPDEYHAVLTCELRRQGDAITLTDLEEVMNLHWRLIKLSSKGRKGNDDGEIVSAKFRGVCYNCNKTGHKAYRCRERDTSGKSSCEKKGKFNAILRK